MSESHLIDDNRIFIAALLKLSLLVVVGVVATAVLAPDHLVVVIGLMMAVLVPSIVSLRNSISVAKVSRQVDVVETRVNGRLSELVASLRQQIIDQGAIGEGIGRQQERQERHDREDAADAHDREDAADARSAQGPGA